MTHTWDPDRYLAYADERGRPFVELVARVGATDPREVVEHRDRVGDVLGDRERALGRGRGQTALGVADLAPAEGLVAEARGQVVRQPRPAVEAEERGAVAHVDDCQLGDHGRSLGPHLS